MTNFKSDLTIKVLGYYFMNSKARHYIRELAKILQLDPGNLSRKMSEFKKEGLFLAEKEGKNCYFSLNKSFPLLREYRNIYEAKFGLEQSLGNKLKKIIGLKEAYLFGSYVKGNFEEGSDIDLLVVGAQDHIQVSRCVSIFEKRLHREINIVDFSKTEFTKKMNKKDPFLKNIFSEKTIKIA